MIDALFLVTLSTTAGVILDHVQADVIAQDCNAEEFGNDYRFGFNGQMKDNNLKGTCNSLDFGARIYDGRLARFLSLDPEAYKYPYWSPYSYAANSPMKIIDDGNGRTIDLKSVAATKEAGKPIVTVKMDITIKIAVINMSSKALSSADGVYMASLLESHAAGGLKAGVVPNGANYVNLLKDAGIVNQPKDVGLKSYESAEIRYEYNLKQTFRFVENVSQIRNDESILILSNETAGGDHGGVASSTIGVSSIDIKQVVPGSFFSADLTLKDVNGGNHEVGHELGLVDLYKKGFSPNNLMGNNSSFNLTPDQFAKIAVSAIIDMAYSRHTDGRNSAGYSNGTKLKYGKTGEGRGRYRPGYGGMSIKDRINLHIKHNNVGTK